MRSRGRRFASLAGGAVAGALALAGCAVQWQNLEPRQALEREAAPPGSVYAGWRVFQARCTGCHGAEATGSAQAPDLTVSLRQMGPRRFASRVLQRYDWGLGTDEAATEQVLARREPPMLMPAWGSEPQVSAHLMDLYAYLAARAEGTQGPGRPAPR